MATLTCGRFTFDPATQMVEGPGEYMADQGNDLLDKIMAGQDSIFSMTAHFSPSAEMAVLVRLQTDFAGWHGVKQIVQIMGVRRGTSRI
jgi:hypothetical protein